MHLTHKIRIFPSKEQEEVLKALSERCRLLYNFSLLDRKKNWTDNKGKSKEERKHITYQDQQNQLPSLKLKYPEYQWVYSKVLQMTLKRLDGSYRSFFSLWKNGDKTARPPRFKGKQHFTTLCYNQSGFKLQENVLTLSHKHPSNVELSFELKYLVPTDARIKQVELFQDRRKYFFVSVIYDVPEPEWRDNGLYQAIDLGISNIVSAVNLHGKFLQVKNRRADLYWKKKLERVQARRDHCRKGSRRWNRYHAKLRQMKSKCASQLRDFQHQLSTKLIRNTKARTLIVGDLHVKVMATKEKASRSPRQAKAQKTLHHGIHNTGTMGRFVEFLTYKARKAGKRVIKIDESYTTQTCCCCGTHLNLALFDRSITCECGNRLDRDLNAAINIMVRFLAHKDEHGCLSRNPRVDGESFLARWNGLLRHTAPPDLEAVADS